MKRERYMGLWGEERRVNWVLSLWDFGGMGGMDMYGEGRGVDLRECDFD